jgi:undecaprenyl-diphosphatase
MEIIKAIFFGIVEGITEWLPISSTGHLILLDEFIKLNVSEHFFELFEVVIQLGAILAVVVMYFKTICPFGFGKKKKERIETWNLWGKILVACVPAAIIGILFDDWLTAHLHNSTIVSLMLIIYGIAFIVIESKGLGKQTTEDLNKITYKQALGVGAFQLLSLIPGTSRSGSTIIGGLFLGLKRSVAAEFTFFLAIPVKVGASLLKVLKFAKDVKKGVTAMLTSQELIILLVACVVAFVVSVLVIKFLMNYIRKHDFKAFGWYLIVLGIIVILYFLIAK